MNTQMTPLALASGQSTHLAVQAHLALTLVEGEVLVHAPAEWIAERVVLPAPLRFTAPAVLALARDCTVTAVRASRLQLHARAPRQLPALGGALARALRLRLQRGGLKLAALFGRQHSSARI